MNYNIIIVYAASPDASGLAQGIARKLQLPFTDIAADTQSFQLVLKADGQKLSLLHNDMELYGDFTAMCRRLKPENLRSEFLVKAAKNARIGSSSLAVDATAGLGEDSILLAASGYRVLLFEHDPIISLLLSDALRRASDVPELSDIISRMKLVEDDSISGLKNLSETPDIVYLDPMFPQRQKSGLIKKKLQILQLLETPCSNESDLMNAALSAKPKRIIVKRPLKGPLLSGVKPTYSIKGKAIRYDCIVLPENNI